MANVQHSHPRLRKYLELIQDVIVLGLCALLFAAMGVKLYHLVRLMITGTDFSLVVGDILFRPGSLGTLPPVAYISRRTSRIGGNHG